MSSICNENSKASNKLMIENVPDSITDGHLLLKVENVYKVEVANIVGRFSSAASSTNRTAIIELSDSDDVDTLLKNSILEINSIKLKLKPYTKDVELVSSNNNARPAKPVIPPQNSEPTQNEPVILKKQASEFPFNLLSKNKALTDELNLKLNQEFDADLLIKADAYEIKRRRKNNISLTKSDNSQVWLQKLNNFIREYENGLFEKTQINKSNAIESFWNELSEFANKTSQHFANVNCSTEENTIRLEGIKDEVKTIHKQILAFINKKQEVIRTENEMVTQTHQLHEDIIKLIKNQKYFEKCSKVPNMNLEYNSMSRAIVFKGRASSIRMAIESLEKLISSIKTVSVSFDWHIVYFIYKSRDYIEEILERKNINCLVLTRDFQEFNVEDVAQVAIKGANESSVEACQKFIRDTIKVVYYDVSENSVELVKNGKFSSFLQKLEDELRKSGEETHKIIKIEMTKKKITCIGEKLLINRIFSELKSFMDSNSIIAKEYKNFTFEDVEYFRKVIAKDIENYIEKLNLSKAFQYELEKKNNIIPEIPELDIEVHTLKIVANKFNQEKIYNFLTDQLKHKIVEEYSLINKEMIEFFGESRALQSLANLEKSNQCVILPPIISNHLYGSKTSKTTTGERQEAKSYDSDEFYVIYNKQNEMIDDEDMNTGLDSCIEIRVVPESLLEFKKSKAIVIFLDNKLQPNNELSNEILQRAGDSISIDLSDLNQINNNSIMYGQVFNTQSGDFKNCKFLLHAILPCENFDLALDEQGVLNASIFNSLAECDICDCESLAFSFFGVFDQPDAYMFANAVIDSIFNYFSINPNSIIKKVYFVESNVDVFAMCFIERSKMPYSPIQIANEVKSPKKSFHKPQKSTRTTNSMIEVVSGSIVNDSLVSDVIVNSANQELNLTNGLVSNAILNLGGQVIQDELNKNYPNGCVNKIAISTAGNLKNKKSIYHVVLFGWDDSKKDTVISELKSTINNLLNLANSQSMQSIAFPAFGANNLKYPINQIPKIMFEACNEFISKNKASLNIKKIYFVIYEKDAQILAAFKNYTQNSNDSDSDDDDDDDEDENEYVTPKFSSYTVNNDESNFNLDFYSNLKVGDSSCSIYFKQVQINVYIGDISSSTNDVVLNPTNSQLDLGGNVASVLVKAGGSSFVNGINQIRSSFSGSAYSSPGELKCKAVLHFDVQNSETKMAMIKALKDINDQGFKNVTFPVIGTGKMNNDPKTSIKNITDGIAAFMLLMNEMRKDMNMKKIDICVYAKQAEFVKYFSENFESLSKQKFLEKKGLLGVVKSFYDSFKNYNIKKILSEEPAEKYVDSKATVFRLISNSTSNLNEVKKKIEQLAKSEIFEEEIDVDYLKKIDSKTKSTIDSICKSESVTGRWNGAKFKLSGRHLNVTRCITSIFKEITEHADNENKKMSAKMLALKIQWQYEKNAKWISHDLYINNEIEDIYQKKLKRKEITWKNDEKYVFDIEKLIQYKTKTPNKTYKMQRINFDDLKIAIRLPATWTANKEQDIIQLDPKSEEYNKTLDLAKNTGLSKFLKRVVSVHRIQNKRLYIQYSTHKEQFEAKYQNTSFEMTLFHGTNEDCVQKIWMNGFNRNYAGKNAVAFGQGVYFARNSEYSHQYTDKRKNKPTAHMFVSKVLVGKTTIGNPTMKHPPDGFDTTVENTASPTIFVIYHDAQAYPEYLITYE